MIQGRKKEALLWRPSEHLESGSFDQRCNVNLIIGELEKSNKDKNKVFALCFFFDVYVMHHDVTNCRLSKNY